MAPTVDPRTLFHLVPKNQAAYDTLSHPDNRHFVSPSINLRGQEEPGLEVGFHIPSKPSGRVIARLGRDADLILNRPAVSRVHVAFEIHPETLVVLLSVLSNQSLSVEVSEPDTDQKINGDCVIVYRKDYDVKIASCEFVLRWRNVDGLEDLAVQGYRESLQRLRNIRPRDLPTEFNQSEIHSWHNTRLNTARAATFREAKGAVRVLIGKGQFGEVYKTVDSQSGNSMAVKVVDLDRFPTAAEQQHARGILHREIKILQRLKHKNIVECLTTAQWESLQPEIFMPWRPGSLRSLTANLKKRPTIADLRKDDELCNQVLRHMLSALDYLMQEKLCHRDVKPENILYWDSPDEGHKVFQLADFGLANDQASATSFCGTVVYQAPELYKEGRSAQSHKMDVWSLLATIIDVHRKFNFPPDEWSRYDVVLRAVRAAVKEDIRLMPMANENPIYRASAAQMLVAWYDGKGLTTPLAKVPALELTPEDDRPEPGPSGISTAVPTPTFLPHSPGKTREGLPLIAYQPQHRRLPLETRPNNFLLHRRTFDQQKKPLPLQPIRAHQNRIAKPRTPTLRTASRRLAEQRQEEALAARVAQQRLVEEPPRAGPAFEGARQRLAEQRRQEGRAFQLAKQRMEEERPEGPSWDESFDIPGKFPA